MKLESVNPVKIRVFCYCCIIYTIELPEKKDLFRNNFLNKIKFLCASNLKKSYSSGIIGKMFIDFLLLR